MNLPDLRILPLEKLVPHEQTDARRVNPLIERLKTESVLSNPPIVAPFGNGDPHFVVLEAQTAPAPFWHWACRISWRKWLAMNLLNCACGTM